MGGGAWPFLVGGAICLVNSVNERDLGLLNSYADPAIQNPVAGELGPAPGRAAGGWGRPGHPAVPPPAAGAPPRRAVGSAATLLEGLPASSRRRLEAITGLDALRCSGLHARYTDRDSESLRLGRRVRATSSASIVLGIDRCNCRS